VPYPQGTRASLYEKDWSSRLVSCSYSRYKWYAPSQNSTLFYRNRGLPQFSNEQSRRPRAWGSQEEQAILAMVSRRLHGVLGRSPNEVHGVVSGQAAGEVEFTESGKSGRKGRELVAM
jgi:hypothetical protein